MSDYTSGLDLGQAQDFTALATIQRHAGAEPTYDVVELRRFKLGSSYPAIIAEVKAMHAGPPLVGRPLVVDETGVGRPVIDAFRAGAIAAKLVPVTITAGHQVTEVGDGYHVPKRDLVSTLAVLLAAQRLRIAQALPEAKTLAAELKNFRVKISVAGHDSYGAGGADGGLWREGAHDDLLLALALACWHAEHAHQRPPIGALTFGGVRGGWLDVTYLGQRRQDRRERSVVTTSVDGSPAETAVYPRPVGQ